MKQRLTIGLLAHVDAGKTTLSEAMLYLSGVTRTLGRVDRQDAFLDTDAQERARGITIFSKQARFSWKDLELTLLDTPGHVDFSAEMERTLQVLDHAVLIVSGADGVQGHTETLWKLLKRHHIPTFVFVNKMDQPGTDKEQILRNIQERLSENCVDFTKNCGEAFEEAVAMCDEALLEQYLESGTIPEKMLPELIAERKLFPVYFGSALKVNGVEELLDALWKYAKNPAYGVDFGAKVFKIARDSQGNRLTHLKVTGGCLKVRDLLAGQHNDEPWEEKVSQIRLYSGEKYETVSAAEAGTVCTVLGLTKTYPGQGLGAEQFSQKPYLEPVLNYQMILPEGVNVNEVLGRLRQFEEEEPELHIVWDETVKELHVQLMGAVQIEIIQTILKERYGLEVTFGTGSLIYKETIADTAEGIGHYEPLRHYAEVHLLLEPGERGSGLVFETRCSEDFLAKNWQRLILTHLEERKHRGVLTGAELTDVKISIVGGKAHLKHTEGGDFRQSTYRAVRQGLMKAESVLLEPVYEFRLEIPPECLGRAMTDVEKMYGKCDPPELGGETAVLTGTAPVAEMQDYTLEMTAYTKGRGKLTCVPGGYAPCHNADEVIAEKAYDPESDLRNPSGSVFCAHGAGYYVPWNEVDAMAHIETPYSAKKEKEPELEARLTPEPAHSANTGFGGYGAEEKELEAIFTRTYGERKVRENSGRASRVYTAAPAAKASAPKKKEPLKEYLLVDGYNIVFAWEELKELAEMNIEAARGRLMDILCNYQGYKGCTLILVFDAYKVPGNPGEMLDYHNIHVVYTKEAETADQYIEKLAHEMGRKYHVTVATSDGLEQLIIRGQGCQLLSARELWNEIERMKQELRREYLGTHTKEPKNYLFDHLDEELAFLMEQVRLGKCTDQ